jgi:hypothetical protein
MLAERPVSKKSADTGRHTTICAFRTSWSCVARPKHVAMLAEPLDTARPTVICPFARETNVV